ncbi:MAG: efflux RND transporter periplasmic adaptor subunit [Acidobacteria bacterium]|nr:efflux RND transporter periplasmic adaptor subunit [Acidobacteriota bacterium]
MGGCTRRASEPASASTANVVPVGGQIVEAGSLRAVIQATGVITPAPGAEFLAVAPEPARVAEITRAAGDPVASGDLLVRFDIPGAADAVSRQRAEVARLQVLVESTRVSQARTRELFERGIVSRREMEDADRELAVAQADAASARAAQAAAEAAVGRSLVRAPFSGIVVSRLHEPGDLVDGTAADPVLRVIDPGRIEVTATIRAADASRVLPGASARLAAAAGTMPIGLTVASSASSAGPGASDVQIRLAFPEPAALAVDTPVEVDIDAEERTNVVLIPAEAVLGEGGETSVFVASGNRAERRLVTLGLADEARVEITSGLEPGDMLITRGHVNLEDGALITVDTGAR